MNKDEYMSPAYAATVPRPTYSTNRPSRHRRSCTKRLIIRLDYSDDDDDERQAVFPQ